MVSTMNPRCQRPSVALRPLIIDPHKLLSVPAKPKEEARYYYVLRGKYDEEGDAFFRGYVTKAKYQEQQSGTWKFKGNSSHDCEKLTKWIMDNQDAVDQENKTFRNPDVIIQSQMV